MINYREFSRQYNDWLMHADHGNTTKASKKYFSNNEPPSHVAYQLAKAGMTVEQVGEYCERMELASGLGSGSRKYYNEVFKIFKENYVSHSNIGNDFREFSELYHHGILGMHWGIRRYQNPDGTLTAEGKARYDKLKDKAGDYAQKSQKLYSKGIKNMGIIDGMKFDYYYKKAQRTSKEAKKYGTETLEEKQERLKKEGNVEEEASKLGYKRDKYNDFSKDDNVKDSTGKEVKLTTDVDKEIFNDEKAIKTVKDFTDNFSEHDNNMKNEIAKEFADDNWNHYNEKQMRNLLDKENSNYHVSLNTFKGRVTAYAYYELGEEFGYHAAGIEYDPVTKKKIGSVSLNG